MESAYNLKLKELKKYIPFLQSMVKKLKSISQGSINPRQEYLDKIRSLRDLLVKEHVRTKMENLLKCEKVLINLYTKFELGITLPDTIMNNSSQTSHSMPMSLPPSRVTPLKKNLDGPHRKLIKVSKAKQLKEKKKHSHTTKRVYTGVQVSPEHQVLPPEKSPHYRRSPKKLQKRKERKKERLRSQIKSSVSKLNTTLQVPDLNTEDILQITNRDNNDIEFDIDTLTNLKTQLIGKLKNTGVKEDILSNLISKNTGNKEKKRSSKKKRELEEGELFDSESEDRPSDDTDNDQESENKSKHKLGEMKNDEKPIAFGKYNIVDPNELSEDVIPQLQSSSLNTTNQNQVSSLDITTMSIHWPQIRFPVKAIEKKPVDVMYLNTNQSNQTNQSSNQPTPHSFESPEEEKLKQCPKEDNKTNFYKPIAVPEEEKLEKIAEPEQNTEPALNERKKVEEKDSLDPEIYSTSTCYSSDKNKDREIPSESPKILLHSDLTLEHHPLKKLEKDVSQIDILQGPKNNNFSDSLILPQTEVVTHAFHQPEISKRYEVIEGEMSGSKSKAILGEGHSEYCGLVIVDGEERTGGEEKKLETSEKATDVNPRKVKICFYKSNAKKVYESKNTSENKHSKIKADENHSVTGKVNRVDPDEHLEEVIPRPRSSSLNTTCQNSEIKKLSTPLFEAKMPPIKIIEEELIDMIDLCTRNFDDENSIRPTSQSVETLIEEKVTQSPNKNNIPIAKPEVNKMDSKTESALRDNDKVKKGTLVGPAKYLTCDSSDEFYNHDLNVPKESLNIPFLSEPTLKPPKEPENVSSQIYDISNSELTEADEKYFNAPLSPEAETIAEDFGNKSPLIIPANPVEPSAIISTKHDVDMRVLPPMTLPQNVMFSPNPSIASMGSNNEQNEFLMSSDLRKNIDIFNPDYFRDHSNSPVFYPGETPWQNFPNVTLNMILNTLTSYDITTSDSNFEKDQNRDKQVHALQQDERDQSENRDRLNDARAGCDGRSPRWEKQNKRCSFVIRDEMMDQRSNRDRYPQPKVYSRLTESRADCPPIPSHNGRGDYPGTPSPFGTSECPMTPSRPFGYDCPPTSSHPFGMSEVPRTPSHLFGRSEYPRTPSHPFGLSECPTTSIHPFGRYNAHLEDPQFNRNYEEDDHGQSRDKYRPHSVSNEPFTRLGRDQEGRRDNRSFAGNRGGGRQSSKYRRYEHSDGWSRAPNLGGMGRDYEDDRSYEEDCNSRRQSVYDIHYDDRSSVSQVDSRRPRERSVGRMPEKQIHTRSNSRAPSVGRTFCPAEAKPVSTESQAGSSFTIDTSVKATFQEFNFNDRTLKRSFDARRQRAASVGRSLNRHSSVGRNFNREGSMGRSSLREGIVGRTLTKSNDAKFHTNRNYGFKRAQSIGPHMKYSDHQARLESFKAMAMTQSIKPREKSVDRNREPKTVFQRQTLKTQIPLNHRDSRSRKDLHDSQIDHQYMKNKKNTFSPRPIERTMKYEDRKNSKLQNNRYYNDPGHDNRRFDSHERNKNGIVYSYDNIAKGNVLKSGFGVKNYKIPKKTHSIVEVSSLKVDEENVKIDGKSKESDDKNKVASVEVKSGKERDKPKNQSIKASAAQPKKTKKKLGSKPTEDSSSKAKENKTKREAEQECKSTKHSSPQMQRKNPRTRRLKEPIPPKEPEDLSPIRMRRSRRPLIYDSESDDNFDNKSDISNIQTKEKKESQSHKSSPSTGSAFDDLHITDVNIISDNVENTYEIVSTCNTSISGDQRSDRKIQTLEEKNEIHSKACPIDTKEYSAKVQAKSELLPDNTNVVQSEIVSDRTTFHNYSEKSIEAVAGYNSSKMDSLGSILSRKQDKTTIKELLSILTDDHTDHDKMKEKLEKQSEIVSNEAEPIEDKTFTALDVNTATETDDTHNYLLEEVKKQVTSSVSNQETQEPQNEMNTMHIRNHNAAVSEEIQTPSEEIAKESKASELERTEFEKIPKNLIFSKADGYSKEKHAKTDENRDNNNAPIIIKIKKSRKLGKEKFKISGKNTNKRLKSFSVSALKTKPAKGKKSKPQAGSSRLAKLEKQEDKVFSDDFLLTKSNKSSDRNDIDEKSVTLSPTVVFDTIDKDVEPKALNLVKETETVRPKFRPGPKSKTHLQAEKDIEPQDVDDFITEITKVSKNNSSFLDDESPASSLRLDSLDLPNEYNEGVIKARKTKQNDKTNEIAHRTEQSWYSESELHKSQPSPALPTMTDWLEPDWNCFIDRSYCFSKKNKAYTCRLCGIQDENIVKHYKKQHPHYEIPLSRMNPLTAKEAIEECELVNFQQFSKVPVPNYVCRFCLAILDDRGGENVLEGFFWHVVSEHTGEYKQVCAECTTVKTCTLMLDIPPPPQGKNGLLLGHICGKCNYTQVSLVNLRNHVLLRHKDEETKVYRISLGAITQKMVDSLKSQIVEDKSHALRSRHSKTTVNYNNHKDQSTIKLENPPSPRSTSIWSKIKFEDETENDIETVYVKREKEDYPADNFRHFEECLSSHINEPAPFLEQTVAVPAELYAKKISEGPTSDVFLQAHFKVNYTETGKKEYLCCINGHEHYKSTLMISMKKHVQIKHSEQRWDGFCSVCKAIVMPQGVHNFKQLLAHLLDTHINFPELEKTPVETPPPQVDPEKEVATEIRRESPRTSITVCPEPQLISQPPPAAEGPEKDNPMPFARVQRGQRKRSSEEPVPTTPAKLKRYGLDTLPINQIFDEPVQCSLCDFSNKVRQNMIRHFQLHSQQQNVPQNVPVNPVPNLETNEMHCEVEEAESIEALLKKFGAFCEPQELKYKCPLCNQATEDYKEAMQSHLYEELNYRKWGCSVCTYKSFHQTGLKNHAFNEHKQNLDPLELPSDREVEAWVAQLLKHQEVIIQANLDKLQKQKQTQMKQITPEKDTNIINTNKPSTSQTTENAHRANDAGLNDENLEQALGRFGAPSEGMFACPKCEYRAKEELLMINHLIKEIDKLKWRCSICHEFFQLIHEAQLHCKSVHPGQVAHTERTICDFDLRNKWIDGVLKTQKETLKNIIPTVPSAVLSDTPEQKSPAEKPDNSHLGSCHEETVPSQEKDFEKRSEDSLDKRKNAKLEERKIKKNNTGEDNDDERLVIDEPQLAPPAPGEQCPYCEFRTNFKNSKKMHILRHFRLKPYKCAYCDFNGHNSTVMNHIVTKHPGEKFVVDRVAVPTGKPAIMNLNLRIGRKKDLYTCLLCDKKIWRKDLYAHVHPNTEPQFAQTGGDVFKCRHCVAMRSSMSGISEHHNADHPNLRMDFDLFKLNGAVKLLCREKQCYWQCSSMEDLKSHYNVKHPSAPLKYETTAPITGSLELPSELSDRHTSCEQQERA